MGLERGIEGAEPIRPEAVGLHERHRAVRSWRMATGTLACPSCDAPVSPGAGVLSPTAPLACPFCHHAAATRDFLSLASPSRPARVAVHVVQRSPRPAVRGPLDG
ncbi:hypothetical protein FSW04_18135 [Baekduia soli]|uniref:Uncharacterized protein n=1 Tax=Baekduia soli TaxID=496014 RepID=A0A5B8U8M7_9ACTN|nr:hypothetical protein [Baekduia soli]QEC49307.1 hypothetical protein FSW04_18135 [Baekduia soli]